jgi:hypothetical protein
LKRCGLFILYVPVDQKQGQEKIENEQTSTAGKVKSHPWFVLSQYEINNRRGYCRQYRQADKDADNYLFFHGYMYLCICGLIGG